MTAVPVSRFCPCLLAGQNRNYPVARRIGGADRRFTTALVHDVGEVLAWHGFPDIHDDTPDFYALMWCMSRYVFGLADDADNDDSAGEHGTGCPAGGDGS